jgi:hypothetical protein
MTHPTDEEYLKKHKMFHQSIQDYKDRYPGVDWTKYELIWNFDNESVYGIKVVGHQLSDRKKDEQIEAMMSRCCCHPEGCP